MSMQSAIRSRDGSEYFIPVDPLVSPSEITGVPVVRPHHDGSTRWRVQE
jgi:hypothetical protein